MARSEAGRTDAEGGGEVGGIPRAGAETGGAEADGSAADAAGSDTADPEAARRAEAERREVAAFRQSLGLDHLVDVHTHFMPQQVLSKVWAYFDAAGPLVGRHWPIAYRMEEQRRVEVLRGFGVRAFTSMLYPHKPGMARWLNDWSADFAARTPDCLHTATFFAEPGALADVRRALGQGARVFKCHVQVGGFDPNDPHLDAVWRLLADEGVPVVTHCGSGPVPGAHTGPAPIAALLARHPGCGWSSPTSACPSTRTSSTSPNATATSCSTPPWRSPPSSSPPPLPPRRPPSPRRPPGPRPARHRLPQHPLHLRRRPDRPAHRRPRHPWLRAVCHDNATRLFSL